METNIEDSWKKQLHDEFDKPYFIDLIQFVNNEYTSNNCYPPKHQIFSALDYTPFSEVKVVIIGQDPYHGANQAHGLCFSVNKGVKLPPSLVNIIKEIEADIGSTVLKNGSLESWANQGVLLLNATLTVRASEAGSHQKKGWEQFSDEIISKLSSEREGIVFMLWGSYAKKKGRKIDASKHLVLSTGHPSPLSANRGYWFGNKHFSETNNYLKNIGKEPILW